LEQADVLAMLNEGLQGAPGFDDVARQAVHLDIAFIGDDDACFAIEHHQTLRDVVERGVDLHVSDFELVGFFRQRGLALGQRSLRFGQLLELIGERFEQQGTADDHQKRAGSDEDCSPPPRRQHLRFRYADVNHQGVVAQRTDRNQPRLAVEYAGRTIGASALRHGPIPGRVDRHHLNGKLVVVRMMHQYSAVVAHQRERLSLQRLDRVIYVPEVGNLRTSEDRAQELAVGTLDAPAPIDRRNIREGADYRAGNEEVSVATALGVLEKTTIGQVSLGRRPAPGRIEYAAGAVDQCDHGRLR